MMPLDQTHFHQGVLDGKSKDSKSYVWIKTRVEKNPAFNNLFADITSQFNGGLDEKESKALINRAFNVLNEFKKNSYQEIKQACGNGTCYTYALQILLSDQDAYGQKNKQQIDGILGAKTKEAVRVFQEKYNRENPKNTIKVDGLAGPETLKALLSCYENSTNTATNTSTNTATNTSTNTATNTTATTSNDTQNMEVTTSETIEQFVSDQVCEIQKNIDLNQKQQLSETEQQDRQFSSEVVPGEIDTFAIKSRGYQQNIVLSTNNRSALTKPQDITTITLKISTGNNNLTLTKKKDETAEVFVQRAVQLATLINRSFYIASKQQNFEFNKFEYDNLTSIDIDIDWKANKSGSTMRDKTCIQNVSTYGVEVQALADYMNQQYTVQKDAQTQQADIPKDIQEKINNVGADGILDLSRHSGINEGVLKSMIAQIKHDNKNITVLDLSTCGLTKLPAEIGNLTNLTELNLSGNQLTTLPAGIVECAKMKQLYLGNNTLTGLPTRINKLTLLEYVDISNNTTLNTLPNMDQLAQLNRLDLIGSDHIDLTYFQTPPKLQQLYVPELWTHSNHQNYAKLKEINTQIKNKHPDNPQFGIYTSFTIGSTPISFA